MIYNILLIYELNSYDNSVSNIILSGRNCLNEVIEEEENKEIRG